jgi:ketosteroid isomerase-like protein
MAENSKEIDEAKILELRDRWLRALRTKDLEGIMSCYAPDILVFDLLPPLRYAGADEYKKNWAEWFPTFQGPIEYEVLELTITTKKNVYRTYFTNARGYESLGSVWSFLDLTPFGRQETWEDTPPGRPQTPPYVWWRRHNEYGT